MGVLCKNRMDGVMLDNCDLIALMNWSAETDKHKALIVAMEYCSCLNGSMDFLTEKAKQFVKKAGELRKSIENNKLQKCS